MKRKTLEGIEWVWIAGKKTTTRLRIHMARRHFLQPICGMKELRLIHKREHKDHPEMRHQHTDIQFRSDLP